MSDLQNVLQFLQQLTNMVTNRPKNTGTIFVLTDKYFYPGGGLPPKSGISKFSEIDVVGTLNLCLKTLSTMPRENAPNVVRFGRFRSMSKYICTFWKFSLNRVIGLS